MRNFFRGVALGVVIFCIMLAFSYCANSVITPTNEKIFTVECEVTHLDFAIKQSVANYIMGVRSETGFSEVIPITAEQYAWYSVGDTVLIEVVQKTFVGGNTETFCKIVS